MKCLIFVGVLGVLCYSREYFVGTKCKNSESEGICRLVTDCPEAILSITKDRKHDFLRCGFDRFTEIVCCPVPPPVENSINFRSPALGRSSSIACKKYVDMSTILLSPQIINGEEADYGEFPHMAALGFYYPENQVIKFGCGGSLISDRFVLTASHCFRRKNDLVIVRMGSLYVPNELKQINPAFDYNVSSVVRHPNYANRKNDVALVKLKRRVKLSGTGLLPACLYDKADDPPVMVITGWGAKVFGGARSEKLLKADVRSFPHAECNISYQSSINRSIDAETQICANDGETDTCQGDSGGPLQVVRKNGSNIYSIVGIASNGILCGNKYPGIYTRVYSFLSWIEEIVWRN